MRYKRAPKSLSIFRHLLKTILVPLVIVALSLLILLPVSAVLMIHLSSRQAVINMNSTLEETVADLQLTMNELVENEVIKQYLIDGSERIQVYEILYGVSNSNQFRPYFYLTNTNFTKEAIYQTGSSLAAYNILTVGSRSRLLEHEGQMLQLSNNGINKNFTSPLAFGQAIVDDGELLGFLVMNYYPVQIETMIGNSQQTVLMINSYSRIIYSNNSAFATQSRLPVQYRLGPIIWSNNNIYWIQEHRLESVNVDVITLLDISFISQITRAVLVALLFSGIIAVGVFLIFRNQISKDTFDMLDEMFASLSQYKETGELVPVEVRENSMSDYIEQYNAIAKEIQELISRNQQLTSDTTTAQLKQLQSQFNPHFIFNTLASIQVMIQKDGDAAVEMVQKLAAMLRYSIRFGEESKVLLSDDIEYLKDYLALQKIRFQDLLEYRISIEELDFMIPKLILQPIIENSIQHGFTGDSLFEIQINIYHIKDDLIMIVKDNGLGMSKRRLEQIRKLLSQQPEDSPHVGLVNCHRRLQLFYGEEYGLSIDSIEGKGTTIVLSCKAERKKDV